MKKIIVDKKLKIWEKNLNYGIKIIGMRFKKSQLWDKQSKIIKQSQNYEIKSKNNEIKTIIIG